MKSEVLAAADIRIMVCRVVALCTLIDGYQHFAGTCCNLLQDILYRPTVLHGIVPQRLSWLKC
jgi:hypothetical protein